MIRSVHRRLRSAADRAALLCGFLAQRERSSARGLTVLMYHRVLPDERCADYPLASLAMPLSSFREQVRWLVSRGEVLPLAAALERGRLPGERRRRLFAITVDDGYEDSALHVAPVLEEAGVRGTFFVTTGFIGKRELLWFDKAVLLFARAQRPTLQDVVARHSKSLDAGQIARICASSSSWIDFLKHRRESERRAILAELEEAVGGSPPIDGYQGMSVDQLVALHERGHEIGSHTLAHPLLPQLDDGELQKEVEESRKTLGAWLGGAVPGFCYPNGDFDDRVVNAVARAGYRYACTTQKGVHQSGENLFRIRRVDIVAERVRSRSRKFDATAFRRELCGLYRPRAFHAAS